MSRIVKASLVVLVTLTAVRPILGAEPVCAAPPGFVDTPHPLIAPAEQLVAHTEEIVINRSLAVVTKAIDKPLEKAIHKGGSLPGVSGTYLLTKGEFRAPGSRRITCLTDSSTLEEEILQNDRDDHSIRFRYVVWNYTSEKGRPVAYGVGDFHYLEIGAGRTHVSWTYSFKLKDGVFPGNLGALGRFLFRVGFLDRDYSAMMRGTLNGNKQEAEQRPIDNQK
jgi:hypothetical protein